MQPKPDSAILGDAETCKNACFLHSGATCTQKHSSGSTFEPPALKRTACAARLTHLELKSASQAALLSCWNMQKLKSASQAALLRCWNMQKHVDSIGLSSDSLIFPSESLSCFDLCYRIDSAQFWLAYLSFGVAVLLRPVLSSRLCSVLTSLSFLRCRCTASNFTLLDFTCAVRRICESSNYIYIYIYI